jgi:hypothetical protein
MVEEIRIRYFHPDLKLGLQDIRNVWLLDSVPVKLTASLHRGNLVFRLPVSGKRISYATLKRGLIRKQFIIRRHYSLLPF